MTVKPLPRPPESMRPDRPESITAGGSGLVAEIEPGVSFECLVGESNGARGLTTGIVTVAPSVALRYHTHPFTESITLLAGKAVAAVEGREYELSPLDNVVVPRGLAHQVRNLSATEPAVFHIALAAAPPTRDLVEEPTVVRTMPPDSTGVEGAERVTRFATAHRFEAGPSTSFIDEFNETLMPGLEVSGGYGRFGPGGRLFAHVHDFDESICIIEGTATCIVEGRRYEMSGNATAMVPRGRVHYFVNTSDAPMAMIWVYAGPSPIRIVVDETCATVEGCPWSNPEEGGER